MFFEKHTFINRPTKYETDNYKDLLREYEFNTIWIKSKTHVWEILFTVIPYPFLAIAFTQYISKSNLHIAVQTILTLIAIYIYLKVLARITLLMNSFWQSFWQRAACRQLGIEYERYRELKELSPYLEARVDIMKFIEGMDNPDYEDVSRDITGITERDKKTGYPSFFISYSLDYKNVNSGLQYRADRKWPVYAIKSTSEVLHPQLDVKNLVLTMPLSKEEKEN